MDRKRTMDSLDNQDHTIEVRATWEGRELVWKLTEFHLRLGKLLEEVCQRFQMMVYEIEYMEIMGNASAPTSTPTSFRVGSSEADCCEYLDEWISKMDAETQYCTLHLHPRRRDESGNVIKENLYLENYQRYLVKKDEEEYSRYFDQMVEEEERRRELLQGVHTPYSSITNVVLRNFLQDFVALSLSQAEPEPEPEMETEPVPPLSSVNTLLSSLLRVDLDVDLDADLPRMPLQASYPSTSTFRYIFSNLSPQPIFSMQDVKVSLTQEEYDQIPCQTYGTLTEALGTQCIICGDDYKEEDWVKVTPCHHLLHDECLKPWLLKESKKCPVCRCELGKGHAHLEDEDESEGPYSSLEEVE